MSHGLPGPVTRPHLAVSTSSIASRIRHSPGLIQPKLRGLRLWIGTWLSKSQTTTLEHQIDLSADETSDLTGGTAHRPPRLPARARQGQQHSHTHAIVDGHSRSAAPSTNALYVWSVQAFIYCFILLGILAACKNIHMPSPSSTAQLTCVLDIILAFADKGPPRNIRITLIVASVLMSILYSVSVIRVIQIRHRLSPTCGAGRKPPAHLVSRLPSWVRPQYLPSDHDSRLEHDTIFAPKSPVRVHHPDDEDMALDRGDRPVCHRTQAERRSARGSESHAAHFPSLPPPAYGLWQYSVRADPALLYWRPAPESELRTSTPAHRRPPSYVSAFVPCETEAGSGRADAGLIVESASTPLDRGALTSGAEHPGTTVAL